LNRPELLRDLGVFGLLWAALVTVIFQAPDIPVTTKYELVIAVSLGTVIAAPLYFGWDKIRARGSFVLSALASVLIIALLSYMAYLLDLIALLLWQWFSINGVLVVTWFDVFATVLVLLSGFMYYWVILTARSLLMESKKTLRARPRKKRPSPAP
jgi:hypothetical protein